MGGDKDNVPRSQEEMGLTHGRPGNRPGKAPNWKEKKKGQKGGIGKTPTDERLPRALKFRDKVMVCAI